MKIQPSLVIRGLAALVLVGAPAVIRAEDAPKTPVATPAAAPEPSSEEPDATAEAVAGGRYVDVNERGRARFEEFRDVPDGAVLEFGRFAWTPRDRDLVFSFTAMDALQDDQRYFARLERFGKARLEAHYVEVPRFYSAGSRTLWSGAGTGRLTIPEAFRQQAESLAGAPTAPQAAGVLGAWIRGALAEAAPLDLRTKREDLGGRLEISLHKTLTLDVTGRYDAKEGTRPLGFGTYIRRQALSGIPGTGAGFFWRESVEARGSELIEPVDYGTTEFSATLTWARNGHSASAGYFASRFRNDVTTLTFDNPFEASPGRASASAFDPRADQEPASPFGNNNLRGLYARSAVQLFPNNDYGRAFLNASVRLGKDTRFTATVTRGTLEQDDRFMPYAENDQVVASVAGAPVVLARDLPLPRASLGGSMETTQADAKIAARVTGALSLRAAFRHYELDDQRPQIAFPGFSSSGDAYFRAGIGQRDAAGNRVLTNGIGGYTRRRLSGGAAWRVGRVTLDGEYVRTGWEYHERQVEETAEDAFKGTVRVAAGRANVNASYTRGSRDTEGAYRVGLETSGVRAYDVWARDRDQVALDVDVAVDEELTLAFGANYGKDEYPGAVTGFGHAYGLQDSRNGSLFAGATFSRDEWLLGAWAGRDHYEWNSLQVTKSSLGADYNPTNRWTRASKDDVYWVGFEGVAPLGKKGRLRADANWQKFTGDWITTSLATPDINSAVAYPFPESSDSTLSARASLLWNLSGRVAIEGRYLYEPFRLDDFTTDLMQPYMQGLFQETRSSATDLGPMNVSRFLFLDARLTDATPHVLSAFLHLRF